MTTAALAPVHGILVAREKCEKGCGASFAWAITTKGRRMPVDPTPVPKGNLALGTDHLGVLQVFIVGPGDEVKGDRYVSHFATCPNASRFRR